MKKGLESFSSLQVGSLRITITFLCLLPTALRNLKYLTRTNILSLLIIGLFGSVIPAFLFPLAETRISSSLAGMLNSLSPVFTLVLGVAIYERKAIKAQIAGIVLGLIGAAGLLYSGSLTFNLYGLLVVLATIIYGLSANEVSKVKGINGFKITALSFFVIKPSGNHLPLLLRFFSTSADRKLDQESLFYRDTCDTGKCNGSCNLLCTDTRHFPGFWIYRSHILFLLLLLYGDLQIMNIFHHQ